MFNAVRVLRNRDGASWVARRWSTIAASRWTKEEDRQRRKFRCYVPFVWQSVLATVAGFVVMAAGAGFCIAGFYSGQQRRGRGEQEINNDTEVFTNIPGRCHAA